VHFVHRDPTTGNLAVVGVYFDTHDAEHKYQANEFIDSLDLEIHGANVTEIPVMEFIKNATRRGSFYQYEGSLTTPTCDEIVTFNIFKDPLYISEDSLEHFTTKWANNTHFASGKGNNRAI